MSAAGTKAIDPPILKADRITLAFGGIRALSEISLEIRRREILGIIGPNGAGKTSLLNVINGFYLPQRGVIEFKGEIRRRRLADLVCRTEASGVATLAGNRLSRQIPSRCTATMGAKNRSFGSPPPVA